MRKATLGGWKTKFPLRELDAVQMIEFFAGDMREFPKLSVLCLITQKLFCYCFTFFSVDGMESTGS